MRSASICLALAAVSVSAIPTQPKEYGPGSGPAPKGHQYGYPFASTETFPNVTLITASTVSMRPIMSMNSTILLPTVAPTPRPSAGLPVVPMNTSAGILTSVLPILTPSATIPIVSINSSVALPTATVTPRPSVSLPAVSWNSSLVVPSVTRFVPSGSLPTVPPPFPTASTNKTTVPSTGVIPLPTVWRRSFKLPVPSIPSNSTNLPTISQGPSATMPTISLNSKTIFSTLMPSASPPAISINSSLTLSHPLLHRRLTGYPTFAPTWIPTTDFPTASLSVPSSSANITILPTISIPMPTLPITSVPSTHLVSTSTPLGTSVSGSVSTSVGGAITSWNSKTGGTFNQPTAQPTLYNASPLPYHIPSPPSYNYFH